MAIADATIRVYSASALIFSERKKYSKNTDTQELVSKIPWPFQNSFLGETCDWNRGEIFKEYQKLKDLNLSERSSKINENLCFLLYVITFRDEYCHTEYYDNCEKKPRRKDLQEYLKKRHKIVEYTNFEDRILEANIIFLMMILENIQLLCQFWDNDQILSK